MLHVGLRLFITLNIITSAMAFAGEQATSRKPASLGSYAAKLSVGSQSVGVNPELFQKTNPAQAKVDQDSARFSVKPIEHGGSWSHGSIPAYY